MPHVPGKSFRRNYPVPNGEIRSSTLPSGLANAHRTCGLVMRGPTGGLSAGPRWSPRGFLGRPPRSGSGGTSDLPGVTKNSAIGVESVLARRSNVSRVGFSSPRSIRTRYPRAIAAFAASRFWDTPWVTRTRRRFQARSFDAGIEHRCWSRSMSLPKPPRNFYGAVLGKSRCGARMRPKSWANCIAKPAGSRRWSRNSAISTCRVNSSSAASDGSLRASSISFATVSQRRVLGSDTT